MEQLLTGLLSGDLDAASLLMLFIVGILTKRFVPWWVHEDVVKENEKLVKELEKFEDAAPALLEEVATMVAILQTDPRYSNSIQVRKAQRKLSEKQEVLRHALPRSTRRRERVVTDD